MKRGFTLAEVLITLTIIGIISALTLPGLRTSMGDRKANAWYSKYCTIIDGAVKQAMFQNNVANATDVTFDQLKLQLQGMDVTENGSTYFYMKDGTKISMGDINGVPAVRALFPTNLNIGFRHYLIYNALEGVDCRNNGQGN